MADVNQYTTYFYQVVGPTNETKNQVVNGLAQTTTLQPGAWGAKMDQGGQFEEAFIAASEETDQHYIIVKSYNGIGNPVSETIYFDGKKFDALDFREDLSQGNEETFRQIKEKVQEQKRQELRQQKQKLQQQQEQINQTLQQLEEELSEVDNGDSEEIE